MRTFVNWIRALAITLGAPGLFLVSFLDSSVLSLPEPKTIRAAMPPLPGSLGGRAGEGSASIIRCAPGLPSAAAPATARAAPLNAREPSIPIVTVRQIGRARV